MNQSSMGEADNLTAVTDWLQKDAEFASMLTPVVAYVSILMVSGIIGNSLVCYICYIKWKEKKIRYFIGTLATLDLLTSLICMPMEIAMLSHPVVLDIEAMCKLQRFSRAVTSLGAGIMLVIIAIDRYISICKHTRARIQARQARFMCVVAVLIAFLFSWPALVLFGKMNTENFVIAETSCSTSLVYDNTLYPVIYYGVIFILFFGISFSLIVFYTLIWLKILRLPDLSTGIRQSASESDFANSYPQNGLNDDVFTQKSAEDTLLDTSTLTRVTTLDKKQKRSCTSDKSVVDFSSDSCDLSNECSRTNTIERKNKAKYHNDLLSKDDNTGTLTLTRPRKNTMDKRTKSFTRKSSVLGRLSLFSSGKGRHDTRRRRITVAMFIITIVQIVSFLPYISLLICKSFVPDFLNSMDPAAQVLYNIGILSHFFSSGVNPWVYGFYSKIFRREFKKACFRKLERFDSYKMNRS